MNKQAHLATFLLGATAGIFATILYVRSGRHWEREAEDAQEWFDERTRDLKKTMGRGKRSLDRALDRADQTADRLLDSARSAADGASGGVKSTARKLRKAID